MPAANELSLTDAVEALKSGTLSARELVAECLARIAEREPIVRAWEYLDAERALQRARELDCQCRPGPLHGVPVAVKDIIDTADMPTRCGSPLYRNRRPSTDAWCVARLREAGALVLGKTVTTEFAYFTPGQTANPVDPRRTPGGSSSGSAAAVADMMVPVAFGSQTAGSTARPAAYCGTAAYVPTHGEIPTAGIKGLSASLDTIGYLARTVADLALIDSVIRDLPPSCRMPIAPPRRIFLWDAQQISELKPEMRAALTQASHDLTTAGARLAQLPEDLDIPGLIEAHSTVMAREAAEALREEHHHRPDKLSTPLIELIERGKSTSATSYHAALSLASYQRQRLHALLDSGDLILAPAAPGVAPLGLHSTGSPTFSRPWQLLGMPAVVIPGYRTRTGLPLGIQVIGLPGTDQHLLTAAQWIEDVIRHAGGEVRISPLPN